MAATAAVTVPTAVLGQQRAARAAMPGTAGKITFRKPGTGEIWLANADGTEPFQLTLEANAGSGDWAPDGSRFLYADRLGPASLRHDRDGWFALLGTAAANQQTHPVYTAGGHQVIYESFGKLSIISAGGNTGFGEQLFSVPDDGKHDSMAATANDGTIVYQHHAPGDYEHSDIYRIDAFTVVTKIIDGGWAADFSPDSAKLAFVRTVAGSSQIWIADADGSNQVQLTTPQNEGGADNREPAWSPQGDAILFTSYQAGAARIKRIDLTTREIVTVVQSGTDPTWQPINGNTIERVWGQTALDTAVATSRYNWADLGTDDGVRNQAQAVVLSRDDVYLDALGGSALAVHKRGPLLITPTAGLHASTRAELQRILGAGGTVYLLGGTVALSAKVESQVRQLGYRTVRLWGATEYDTAIAVAKEIAPKPSAVIIATALQYYDALAAGAAAGAHPGTVIVLTNGDAMPAATAAYLNTLNPDSAIGTKMIGVGGPGVRALVDAHQRRLMPAWPGSFLFWPVFGGNAFDTAVAVADFFFAGPSTAAVATATTWYDALTGGSMIGANRGPLLLSTPDAISQVTRQYFSRNSASLTRATLLGGPLALQDVLIEPLGEAISPPGGYTYRQYTEHSTTASASAKSITASGAQRHGPASGSQATIPGVTRQQPQRAG
ncbi:cell wall-binding repeat-containing protein [Dactylosporangium sp. NPDC049525]|uniref:cell wall-binding repeat-containing protein n=1 Tax=Dactylosporangium sp. NPDC049525 TaxID=3154730 RepID=UPI00341301B1